MAVTDDQYELPVCVTDTLQKLTDYLGCYKNGRGLLPSLIRSRDGTVRVYRRKLKVFRMNMDGEIIIGNLKGANSIDEPENQRGEA